MSYIENTLIPGLDLWQYYVIDVSSEKEKFTKAWTSSKSLDTSAITEELAGLPRKEVVELFAKLCLNEDWHLTSGKYHAKVADQRLAIAFIAKLLNLQQGASGSASVDEASREFAKILDDLNVDRYNLFNDDVVAILSNTKGRIDYTRLAGHGPKLGKITAK